MSVALPSLSLPARQPLAEQLMALRRHWRLILFCALGLPALALAGLLALPPRYSATGILLYDPASAALPGAQAGAAAGLDEDAVTASQGAIIASLPAAAAIATQLHLAANPDFNPDLRKRRFPLSLLPRPALPSGMALAEAVQSRLSISVLPGSRVISVAFAAAAPEIAAAAANLAMQIYLDHERDVAFQTLTDAQAWLETHSAQVQQQLDDTEAALARARARAGLVQGAQGMTLTDETSSHLGSSLVEAQAALAMAEARLHAASQAGGDAAAANAAIAPNLLPLRAQQAQLAAQVRSLASEYGPGYPALITARAQLAAVTAQIGAEAAREMDAARAEVAADQAQVATLQTALAHARTQSQTEDEEAAPIRALEQRAEAGRDMLRAITLQAGQLAQDASLTRPDARILSAAAAPARPDSRHGLIVFAASAVLGLCLGVLLAGLRDALDTSLRSAEALRGETGLPCHALLPEVRNPAEAALIAPFSLYAEQLRALRMGLRLGGSGCQILAITAARPDEGKTTLCIAFARALATAGLKVLAVDGDIRQPSFDPVFVMGGLPGLTDHLAGKAALEECLHADPLSPLILLPAGTQAQAALSLLLGPAMPEMLDRLRGEYDVILLDVPPAYALAEGRVLASHADAALLCVRWGRTPRRVVRGAITLLQEAGVRLAGVALSRVNVRTHGASGFADAEFYAPRYGGYFRRG
ncbi:polysaccharide biosynthesis tyrosine autokinase [Acidocella sp.]|uniref:polysaccharide biosynthesis tyrosine autokinase n=1 Tax=Acidocella sp. TaxID=50710 RepID=UPI00263A0702|nr:polysaccharide biosynthesis tyrosine autokinase [Acidocella sp.]